MNKYFSYLLLIPFIFISIVIAVGLSIENRDVTYSQMDQPDYNDDEFVLQGPDELCLYYGSVIGDFFGGGRSSDVFLWRVLDESGNLVVQREGAFQNFSYTFSSIGVYTVELSVRRGTSQVFSASKTVLVNPGADLILENHYLICENGEVEMTLIDPNSSDAGDYFIEWRDASGQVIGNSNTVSVSQIGLYTVEFHTTNDEGQIVCPYQLTTEVRNPEDFNASVGNRPTGELCEGPHRVDLVVNSGVFGEWYYQKEGEGRVLLGDGNRLSFRADVLPGAGDYQFIFVVNDPDNRFCKVEDAVPFRINPVGNFEVEELINSDGCGIDNGSFSIRALGDMDEFSLLLGNLVIDTRFDVKEGEVLVFDNLSAGVYHFISDLGNCSIWFARTINSLNISPEFEYDLTVVEETCTETGTQDGKIIVNMLNVPFTGEFQLLDSRGRAIPDKGGFIDNEMTFEIDVPAGVYHLYLIDDNGCVYPNQFIEGVRSRTIGVNSVGQVEYSVPGLLNICQSFELTPNTSQRLKFILTYPDGSVIERNHSEAFLLDQPGEYTIVGLSLDEEEGLCPLENSIFVNISAPIDFEPVLVFEDCFGNRTYEAELFGVSQNNVNIRWFNERDELVGTGRFLFPTSFGEFKLDVQPINSEPCPNSGKTFQVFDPQVGLDIDYTASPFCPDNPSSEIILNTDISQVASIKWITYDQNDDPIELPEFEGLTEITVNSTGAYEVIMFSDLICEAGQPNEIGRKLIIIDLNENSADFEIPEQLIVCSFYELVPETELDLIFTVTDPEGGVFEFLKDEIFTIDISGTYQFLANSANQDDILCPVTKFMEVVVTQPVPFEAELIDEDCDGTMVYRANIFEEDENEFDFYWFDQNMNLLADQQIFRTNTYGEFLLEVRPKGAMACPDPQVTFFVEEPVLSVDLNISGGAICPDPGFTFLTVETTSNLVETIIWYYEDTEGVRQELTDFENEMVVVVDAVGIYEVVGLNRLGCIIGRDEILILESVDIPDPNIDEEYIICPFLEVSETIDPGIFETYDWFLDGELIYSERFFQPEKPGLYDLTVTTVDGCFVTKSFSVIEDCQFQVVYPNAMQTLNASKNFVIYSNYLVDNLKVWIYNRWGQLVYYCSEDNISEIKASCTWDGTYNGEILPPGSYVLKIQYKNRNEESPKSILNSILIVD